MINHIDKDFTLQLFMSYDKYRTMPKHTKDRISRLMAKVVKLAKGN